MTRRLLCALLAAAAVLAGLGAGCSGGDSTDEYQGAVTEARNNVDEALTQIAEARSRDAFVDRMQQAAIVATRAAEDLGGTDVAEEYEDENRQLVAAFEELATDLDATAQQLELTPELFNTAGLSFDGWDKANRVLQSLERQGLEVEPIARR